MGKKDQALARVAPEQETAAVAAVVPEGEYRGLAMVMSPEEAKSRLIALHNFMNTVMVLNQDYGKIPGAGEKPTLLQPGAQKLAELYGLAHRFEEVEVVRDWDRMFFYFEYRTVLTSRRDGSFVGEGLGSCNSRESKYAYRWAFESDLPAGVDPAKLEKRIVTSRKSGSFGKQYPMFKVPNQDLASVVNTLQKMAAKRSYIHAVIAATRSSGIFTQDVEDLPREMLDGRDDQDDGGSEKPKPAATGSKPEVLKVFAGLATSIEEAADLAALKLVWDLVNKSKKKLDERCLAELEKLKDAKREKLDQAGQAAVKAAVDAMGDFPEHMGGTAKASPAPATKPADEHGDAEPPLDAKAERQPGEEG